MTDEELLAKWGDEAMRLHAKLSTTQRVMHALIAIAKALETASQRDHPLVDMRDPGNE